MKIIAVHEYKLQPKYNENELNSHQETLSESKWRGKIVWTFKMKRRATDVKAPCIFLSAQAANANK